MNPDHSNARPAMNDTPVFDSFFMAGFECTSHVGRGGYRHDLLHSTGHFGTQVLEDYKLLETLGIRTVREGLRWHLVEPRIGQYDFSSVLPTLRAARTAHVQVMWDVVHFGFPDDLDVYSAAFVDRVAGLARAFASVVAEFTPQPWFTPINEVSFLSYAAGNEGWFAPFGIGRGKELKRQLVRASIAATHAIREVAPHARFMQPEPVINVVAARDRPWEAGEALAYSNSQFEAWDMLSGRLEPELGGDPSMLDVVGLNYYPNNQWVYEGHTLHMGDTRWRVFSEQITQIHARYDRPMIVSETGAQGAFRAPWLTYVAAQVLRAVQQGAPVHGLCLYPILDQPGWDDDRHVRCGLYGFRKRGERRLEPDYALELRRWQPILETWRQRKPVHR